MIIMLRSLKELKNYVIKAEDGDIGRSKDFLFDDAFWTIRFMVADTGKWLPGKKVLISPISLEKPDWVLHRFPVRLTKKQIEDGPEIDEAKPVSRQYEIKFYKYYGWPYYWAGNYAWGTEVTPNALFNEKSLTDEQVATGDDHLRSVNEVLGYNIQAFDGQIGHVEDFIIDDRSWTIRYMIVDTKNWLPGKKVLVSPEWIESIDWKKSIVKVDLTQEAVKESPEFDPSAPVNREYEAKLYDFYGKPVYWNREI